MKKWARVSIKRDSGEIVENVQAPTIISASRSTDIPAFYADWFFYRLLNSGYSAWTNPFTGQDSFVSYEKTRCIVFWSKNPLPLIPYLDKLKERGIGCYVQYSLNNYEEEGLEKGVPPLEERIDTFKKLVDKLGKGSVIWRNDPQILTDKINVDKLLEKLDYTAEHLKGYSEKLVFSYADISTYRKVKKNLEDNHVNYREWDDQSMNDFAQRLSELNKKWNYRLATCGEKIDLSQFGIEHNKCIDDELMIRLDFKNKELMDYLGVQIRPREQSLFGEELPDGAIIINDMYAVKSQNNKDTGQRQFCGCMASKDIGQYNTCAHLCEYCYANASKASAVSNWNKHKLNPYSESILGKNCL